MLGKWIPCDTAYRREKNDSVRKYLKKEVYLLRRKWAYTFFADAPTLSLQSTQRNEGWHAKVKSLTSPHMPLLKLAKRLNEIVQEIDRCEQKDSINQGRHRALTSSSLLPETLRKRLEDMNISKFAAEIFALEFSASMRLSVSSPQVTGSIGNSNLVINVQLEYSLPNNDEERSSKPTVIIKVLNSVNNEWKEHCPCCMLERMHIPCRHLLATVL